MNARDRHRVALALSRYRPPSWHERPTRELRPLWRAQEAADGLGRAKGTVYRMTRTRQLPSYRLGRTLRYRPEVIEQVRVQRRYEAMVEDEAKGFTVPHAYKKTLDTARTI